MNAWLNVTPQNQTCDLTSTRYDHDTFASTSSVRSCAKSPFPALLLSVVALFIHQFLVVHGAQASRYLGEQRFIEAGNINIYSLLFVKIKILYIEYFVVDEKGRKSSWWLVSSQRLQLDAFRSYVDKIQHANASNREERRRGSDHHRQAYSAQQARE